MIDFNDVSFSYPGGPPVLKGVSFHIEKGGRVGLIGANGAGKSTILKAMLGLISVSNPAAITISGLPMTRANLPAIRKKLGYVLQDSNNQMFMPTVLDDMVFGPMNYGATRAGAEAKAEAVLSDLGLTGLKNRHNHKLSGGEKRMAAIATILAMEPEGLVMDEPSSSLDPKNRRILINLLNRLTQTKVIASHDLDLILDTCDRVILISHGEVKADGPAQEILRDRAILMENDLELPLSLGDRA